MTGGEGQRLRPLTEDCPKPLLKIHGTPILEIILKQFIAQGFQKFFISVYYKASMIQDYFGTGEKWGVKISYLREPEPLGTAGALSFLPAVHGPIPPLIVMNGDILAKIDFKALLDFHQVQDVIATVAVVPYKYQTPYGVVEIDNNRVKQINEKPVNHYFVNAGLYVLDSVVISSLYKKLPLDMPTLLQKLIEAKQPPACFKLNDYWLDIGQPQDFVQAQRDYAKFV